MTILDVISVLNEKQRVAVQHPIGKPAMVIAGAGSGKTRVLTSRVAWLLDQYQLHPSQILLVTFTNKAAQEMTTRVQMMTGMTLPFSGTFHRLCARILRQSGMNIDISPRFTIYDEDDALSLMTDLMKEIGVSTKEIKPRIVLSMISQAKNELIGPTEYADMARGKFHEAAARLYPLYQRALARNDALDFDDILIRTIDLFTEHPTVLSRYQEQFEHVLIDEYQDTNTAQLALTKLLFEPQHNLFVVGDFSQAIYGWRGADYRNMLSLSTSLSDMVTYKLDQNYRSTEHILLAASSVISHNTTHPVLELWTEQDGGEPIQLFEAGSDIDEVNYVIRKIREHQDAGEDDIAILYRTNAQSRAFEEGLLRAGMPYRLVGGVRFYARKEIKDILAHVRLWLSPKDQVAQARVQKLGKRKLATYLNWLDEEKLKKVDQVDEIEGPKQTVLQIIDTILVATQYLKLFDEQDEEDQARLENIQELRSVAANYTDVAEFLETVALVEQEAINSGAADEVPGITLMSIHAAKGLEFSTVFLVGMEEGLFPHSRSLLDKLQMEEERRLCYVAMTRAKNKLYVTYARKRLVFGRISGSVVSRFVSELPSKGIKREGQPLSSPFSFTARKVSAPSYDKGPKFVPFDDPSIDDFLEGSMDIDTFLSS